MIIVGVHRMGCKTTVVKYETIHGLESHRCWYLKLDCKLSECKL